MHINIPVLENNHFKGTVSRFLSVCVLHQKQFRFLSNIWKNVSSAVYLTPQSHSSAMYHTPWNVDSLIHHVSDTAESHWKSLYCVLYLIVLSQVLKHLVTLSLYKNAWFQEGVILCFSMLDCEFRRRKFFTTAIFIY